LAKRHRSLDLPGRSSEHSCGELNQKTGSEGHQREHGLLHGYLPLASQHLDVKTIGRGGPSQRLFKLHKWTPLFARLSTVGGRSGPAWALPLARLSVRGPAVFLSPICRRHCMAYIRLQTRPSSMSELGHSRRFGRVPTTSALPL